MSFFGGGGGGGGSTPSMQTQIVREAPGIEERKLELMDMARQVAQKPINLPDYQVSGLGSLEQQGINAAGTTGMKFLWTSSPRLLHFSFIFGKCAVNLS